MTQTEMVLTPDGLATPPATGARVEPPKGGSGTAPPKADRGTGGVPAGYATAVAQALASQTGRQAADRREGERAAIWVRFAELAAAKTDADDWSEDDWPADAARQATAFADRMVAAFRERFPDPAPPAAAAVEAQVVTVSCGCDDCLRRRAEAAARSA